jgi:signal transduction histidine kinase
MGEAAATSGFARARQSRVAPLSRDRLACWSVASHMIGLILAIVTPLLLFSALLVLRSALHEQEVTGNAVRERTREAAAALDHELGTLRTRLFLLASSQYLHAGDLAAFHAEATDFVKEDGLTVVLSDLNGQEVVNTRVAFGHQLPVTNNMDAIRHATATGQPYVSNLTRGALTGDFLIAINVPVLRSGKVAYVLSLNIAPILPRLLASLHLPSEWIVTISDREGYTIARDREADRFVGQMGRAVALDRFRAADEGWFPLVSRDGIPVYNAFAHVKLSGWVVAVGMPDDVLYAPVRRSTWFLALAGCVTLALALVLATAISRRIAGAITASVDYAEGVGRGEPIEPRPTGILETDQVVHSLQLASERLRQSAQERAVLLDRTITAQEAERKRIARELHDSLGQYLSALRLGFGAIEPICATSDSAQQRLSALKSLAADLGRELNRIAWELRPLALDDLGLQRAVTQYLEEWAERSRLQIDTAIDLGDRRLPQPVETALFRVLQEAITNVVKHSGADRVSVLLTAAGNEVRLVVEDNGKGFDPSGCGRTPGIEHLGLIGLRERLALVGGALEVESPPQGGTSVYVSIPL